MRNPTRHRFLRSWPCGPALVAAVVLVGTGLGGASVASASSVPAATVPATTAAHPAASSPCPGATLARFGPNVCVFTPSMSQATIQADLNNISTQQVPVSSQFDTNRYAVFFEPGTYGSAANPLVFQVGYYTEVAGLGLLPKDTVVDGAIDVFNNLCTAGTSNCNSDVNFWRSLSNLTLNVDFPSSPPNYAPPVIDAYGPGCANTEEAWSVSQADPLRRMIINGNVVLQDYCAAENYASGGFIADSQINGDLDFYGNQQFMVRNSQISGSNGCPQGLWNMVYSGVEGAPSPVFTGTCEQNTVLPSSPVTEEEPFLYLNSSGKFEVFVPAVQRNSVGPSWASGTEAGHSLPLSKFFLAKPATGVSKINAELALGKDLIITPGIYNIDQPIRVTRANTVVLGQGFATLTPQQGNEAMDISPGVGVKLSGLIFDAGPVNSKVLLSVAPPAAAPPPTPTSSRMSSSASAVPRPRRPRPRSACSTRPATRSSTTCGPGAPTTATTWAGPPTPGPPASRSPAAT